jgi:hypothetical protein
MGAGWRLIYVYIPKLSSDKLQLCPLYGRLAFKQRQFSCFFICLHRPLYRQFQTAGMPVMKNLQCIFSVFLIAITIIWAGFYSILGLALHFLPCPSNGAISIFPRSKGLHFGPGSSVGIATDYGLGGPGIESRWGASFSAPVQIGPGAHPASCTMGTGSFQGVKYGRSVLLTTHPLLVPRSWKSRAISLPTLWATPGL